MDVDGRSRGAGLSEPARDSGSVRERMLQLKSLPVMGQLGAADLLFLARHADVHRLPTGTTVIRRGSRLRSVFLMTRGAVDLVMDGEVRDRLEAPASVGVVPMWAERAAPYDGVTAAPSLMLEVPTEVMFGFFENHPVMLANITAGLATAVLQLQGSMPRDDSANGPDPGIMPQKPLNFVDRLLILGKAPMLGESNIDALGELARHQVEQRYAAGDVIWREGDVADGPIRIVYGVVRAERDGRLARVGAGHRLGGLDALASQPRSYTAIAETDVVGIAENTDVMTGVLEEQPELARRMVGRLANALLDGQGFRIAGDTDWSPLRSQLDARRRQP